jgi:hypothetical protein
MAPSVSGIAVAVEKLDIHPVEEQHVEVNIQIQRAAESLDTIQARGQRDPAFRKALLQEGVECLLAGDVDTGKSALSDYINATMGFEELSQVFDKSSNSLMRMFGPKGNPQASNLFAVIHYLQEQEGIHLEVKARKVA